MVGGLVGLAAATALRIDFAGRLGARSLGAGIVFAGALCAVASGVGPLSGTVAIDAVGRRVSRSGHADPRGLDLVAGLAGGAVLCVPALARSRVARGLSMPSGHGYLAWAIVVSFVAVSEEILLRGSLFTAAEREGGTGAAIAVTSVAFAVIHLPLYGPAAFPLDLAVGLWLGTLRRATGSVRAPAIAHWLADVAGWWLR